MNRTAAFLLTFVIIFIFRSIFFPCLSILLKWMIIGKYKAGMYPLWGSYYLRWWTVYQLQHIMGRGIFLWTPWLMATYYRLLGAKVGTGAQISDAATITEPDLITIGKDACIDSCEIKPFYMDHGCMFLTEITIGDSCSICTKVTGLGLGLGLGYW